MSDPVRYSVCNTILDNENSNSDGIASTLEIDMQRRLNMGRLGMPDAAAAILDNVYGYTQLAQLSTGELLKKLHESVALEAKYQPNLHLPETSTSGEVTVAARDGAAHVLRCLKVWYEMPSDVLFVATNLVDRFLAKMRVRPKHMACISVGSFLLAVRQLKMNINDTDDLAVISQCRCTAGDLERMASIIANKLGVQMDMEPTTSLTFLHIFYILFQRASAEFGLQEVFNNADLFQSLVPRLEMLACDATFSSMPASEIAFTLITTYVDAEINKRYSKDGNEKSKFIEFTIGLQEMCQIPAWRLCNTHRAITDTLLQYNGQQKLPHRQRLVWKLSSRTLRALRPTDRFSSDLPTIEEHNNNSLRFRTGSVSSEEGEDWPTSPILPVYEK